VESGKVRHPERETLERILSALVRDTPSAARFWNCFGYIVDAPLPNEDEINWAIALCQQELASADFPTHLLDCGHRLLAWNAMFQSVPHCTTSRSRKKEYRCSGYCSTLITERLPTSRIQISFSRRRSRIAKRDAVVSRRSLV